MRVTVLVTQIDGLSHRWPGHVAMCHEIRFSASDARDIRPEPSRQSPLVGEDCGSLGLEGQLQGVGAFGAGDLQEIVGIG